MDNVILIAACGGLTALAVCLAVEQLYSLWGRRQDLDRRLVLYAASPHESTLRRESLLRQIGERFDRSHYARPVAQLLADADLDLKPSEWAAALAGAYVVIVIIVGLLLSIDLWLSLAFGLLAVILLSRAFLRSRRNHYIETFESQLAEASLLLGNSLRAGLSLPQAIAVVSREMPRPAGREFDALHREMLLGANAQDAILHMTERLRSNELKVLMTAILVQSQVGGNLAGALTEMSYAMAKRRELHDEVQTLMAEPRFVSLIVPLLPIGLLVIMRNSMPELVQPLFSTPIGWVVLAVFGGLQVLSFVLTHRVADIKV